MLGSCKELTRSSLGKDLSTNPRPFPGERHEKFCIINTFPSYGMHVGTQTGGENTSPCFLVTNRREEAGAEERRRASFPPEFVMPVEK